MPPTRCFSFFFLTLLLSSFWTSRGHRFRPFTPWFLPSILIAHRVQQSHCSSIFHRVLLTHALALSASQFLHKKNSQRIDTSMHSAGLELTKLNYTRLEDNRCCTLLATAHSYCHEDPRLLGIFFFSTQSRSRLSAIHFRTIPNTTSSLNIKDVVVTSYIYNVLYDFVRFGTSQHQNARFPMPHACVRPPGIFHVLHRSPRTMRIKTVG